LDVAPTSKVRNTAKRNLLDSTAQHFLLYNAYGITYFRALSADLARSTEPGVIASKHVFCIASQDVGFDRGTNLSLVLHRPSWHVENHYALMVASSS